LLCWFDCVLYMLMVPDPSQATILNDHKSQSDAHAYFIRQPLSNNPSNMVTEQKALSVMKGLLFFIQQFIQGVKNTKVIIGDYLNNLVKPSGMARYKSENGYIYYTLFIKCRTSVEFAIP